MPETDSDPLGSSKEAMREIEELRARLLAAAPEEPRGRDEPWLARLADDGPPRPLGRCAPGDSLPPSIFDPRSAREDDPPMRKKLSAELTLS